MDKEIGIPAGREQSGYFDAIEVNDGDNIFWVNHDTQEAHWPALISHQVAAFKGISEPATSSLVPMSASKLRYICQLHPDSNENGLVTIFLPWQSPWAIS